MPMSNSIYNSYFYIIQHIETKTYYAGVRFAKKCDPKELLTVDGYCTSSDIVRKIISESGINSFIIRKIKQFQDKEDALNYETRFLKRVNARTNATFFNMHNNTAIKNNLEKSKATFMARYGVEHASQIPGVSEKRKLTMLEKYGEDCYKQTPEALEKSKQTCLEKYGVEYIAQVKTVKDKIKQTCLDRFGFGFTCSFQRPGIREKCKQTSLEKYGTETPLQNLEILAKTRESCLKTLGVEFPLQSPDIRKRSAEIRQIRANREIVKILKSYNEKYGLKIKQGWYQMSDMKLQKILDNYIEKYGTLVN